MIHIQKSATADTRTCDVSKVTKQQLLESSLQHIKDVNHALEFFIRNLSAAALNHDFDKISPDGIDWFHRDFITGFKETGWWDNHRAINRHHLQQDDGVPQDVNLIDVLEYIADCVMAGMGRSGSVYNLEIKPEVLNRAFNNTVDLLKMQVVVEPDSASAHSELRMSGENARTIIRNFHSLHRHRYRGVPLWSMVGKITGHGSGNSAKICESANLDPHQPASNKTLRDYLPNTKADKTAD